MRMTSREFFALLARPSADGELDRLLDRRAGEDLAVLVADSSGFSRRTHEHGIVRALSLVRRAVEAVRPALRKRGGTVLSTKVDNILAVFPDPRAAVLAALDARRLLKRDNARRPADDRVSLCFGIEAGRVLRLADDVYGGPVNVAAKIGEDLAGKDEILVTADVARRVKPRIRTAYSRSTEIGGRTFELHHVTGGR